MARRLLVVGGDAAGMSAAAQARRRTAPDELEIVCFERGSFTSYAACGIPYFVGGLVADAESLVARSPEEHRARGLDVRTRHEVVAIDTARRVLRVRRLDDGVEIDEPFDDLVIATGASPVRPPLPGIEARGVFGIQTLADGLAVHAAVGALGADAPRRAVVVGGGYIGLELAEALVMRGLEVALVEAAPQPMSTLDPDMGALVADALDNIGIALHLGTPVEAFETEDGRVCGVRTSSGVLPADLVVLGLGVHPNSKLASESGISVGATRGIVVDDHMVTSVDGVYAAGDCVETRHLVSGSPVAIALGTHANKQGRVVGINATGGDATFPGVVGTAISKICKYEVARTGLNEGEALAAGFEAVAATIEGETRAHYYPGTTPIHVKVVAERATGRLLGAQIVGEEGAAKRVDVLAAAIWNGMSAEKFASLDLAYAPPFSPVWDPVLIAARKAAEAAGGPPG
ncbi:MAG: FAD-dependent oxidoreductase [Acidimicrobiia bacterium]|nr:FAD-dependent oxidoreductase [Acidimicrobiia bacterium]